MRRFEIHAGVLVACTIALSGCMTQQGGQQSEIGQAMMSGLAQGLLSGAGASLGHGIATGSKRHLAAAAAQAAVGTAATAAAASSRRTPTPRSSSYSAAPEGFPNTPQCRALMQYIKGGAFNRDSEGHPLYGLERLYKMEHTCLASMPDHPASRNRKCGNGKYYHYFDVDLQGNPANIYCGWREAVAAVRRIEATNGWGKPASRYPQTYGLMSLFR